MHRKEKGEYKNLFLPHLEVEGDLALLCVHTLVSQPAEKHLVSGVVRINRCTDASRDDGDPICADRRMALWIK
jgi:hypothetical protein